MVLNEKVLVSIILKTKNISANDNSRRDLKAQLH